ncbi:hypothetical protein D3C87_929530 [compost metagenome]
MTINHGICISTLNGHALKCITSFLCNLDIINISLTSTSMRSIFKHFIKVKTKHFIDACASGNVSLVRYIMGFKRICIGKNGNEGYIRAQFGGHTIIAKMIEMDHRFNGKINLKLCLDIINEDVRLLRCKDRILLRKLLEKSIENSYMRVIKHIVLSLGFITLTDSIIHAIEIDNTEALSFMLPRNFDANNYTKYLTTSVVCHSHDSFDFLIDMITKNVYGNINYNILFTNATNVSNIRAMRIILSIDKINKKSLIIDAIPIAIDKELIRALQFLLDNSNFTNKSLKGFIKQSDSVIIKSQIALHMKDRKRSLINVFRSW